MPREHLVPCRQILQVFRVPKVLLSAEGEGGQGKARRKVRRQAGKNAGNPGERILLGIFTPCKQWHNILLGFPLVQAPPSQPALRHMGKGMWKSSSSSGLRNPPWSPWSLGPSLQLVLGTPSPASICVAGQPGARWC